MALEVLPMKLRTYALYADLSIRVLDFETLREYQIVGDHGLKYETWGGSYYNGEKLILFNKNDGYPTFKVLKDVASGKHHYDIDVNEYLKMAYQKNGNNWRIDSNGEAIQFATYESRNTFFHEFIHFLDFSYREKQGVTDIFYESYWLSAQEMKKLRPFVDVLGYGYNDNMDYEFLAYSAEAYFLFPEYLQENAPEIYKALDKIINDTELYSDSQEAYSIVKELATE